MLAVKVDYEAKRATIGTEPGQEVATEKILDALKSIGYRGEIIQESPKRQANIVED